MAPYPCYTAVQTLYLLADNSTAGATAGEPALSDRAGWRLPLVIPPCGDVVRCCRLRVGSHCSQRWSVVVFAGRCCVLARDEDQDKRYRELRQANFAYPHTWARVPPPTQRQLKIENHYKSS
jgi:hypothetical protein